MSYHYGRRWAFRMINNPIRPPITLKKIPQLALKNCHIKIRETTKDVSIFNDHGYHTLHEKFDMRKLIVRWVLRMLALNEKGVRKNICKVLLEWFKRKQGFFASIHNCRWNLHSLLRRRNRQNKGRTFSKSEDSFICPEVNGLFWYSWHCVHQLSPKD